MIHRSKLHWIIIFLVSAWAVPAKGAFRVVPTPHFIEPLSRSLTIKHGETVTIISGPTGAPLDSKVKIAADILRRDLERADSSQDVRLQHGNQGNSAGTRIFLWNYKDGTKPSVGLNLLDRQVLSDPHHYGQSYVINTPDEKSIWIVGSTGEGVLLGTVSLLQLIGSTPKGVHILGAYIRDYPDFRYRAEDWLLNSEINRWALDRGQGAEAYKRLCERKIDEALRFKINMIFFDGFGWGLKQRFPGYGQLMRSLNQYARERGIRLMYGGYGASYGITYQTGPLYEYGGYMGRVFKNRQWYPDGPTYECMGFPRAKKGVNPRIQGSCRSNDALNHLKAEELRKFVQAVEPGALFIHNEDFGGYNGTQTAWLERCSRCRRRWPNDSLSALNGGAGGLAHGYSALIKAVNSVKDLADGYDASRDCVVVLVSPVYSVNSPSSKDWSNALELWKNTGLQLPKTDNVQVCFREIFPQRHGGVSWVTAFNSAMQNAGVHLPIFLYFSGGADDYTTNYPLTGTPALDAEFRGAATMYKATGNFYEEPQEVIDAEYSWNTRSTGFFREPRNYDHARQLWFQYMYGKDQPSEMFGPNGVYRTACNLLYGPEAGPIMASYYEESEWIPDREAENRLGDAVTPRFLPMTWNRAYAIPRHWRDLAVDSSTWSPSITDEAYLKALGGLNLSPEELHRRLARYWAILAQLNSKGSDDVARALKSDPRSDSVKDMEFLEASFRVDQPLLEALADFHQAMTQYLATPRNRSGARQRFSRALVEAKRANELAMKAFPHPTDPVGGEVGALQHFSGQLVQSIQKILD